MLESVRYLVREDSINQVHFKVLGPQLKIDGAFIIGSFDFSDRDSFFNSPQFSIVVQTTWGRVLIWRNRHRYGAMVLT